MGIDDYLPSIRSHARWPLTIKTTKHHYLNAIKYNPDVCQGPKTDVGHLHPSLIVDVRVPEKLGTRLIEQHLHDHRVHSCHDAAVISVRVEATCEA